MLRLLKKIGKNRTVICIIIVLVIGYIILQHHLFGVHQHSKEWLQRKDTQSSTMNTILSYKTPTANASNHVINKNRIFDPTSTPVNTMTPRMGHVNVHLWYKMCTSTIDGLRLHPLFPLWPSIRGQPEMPNELVSIMASMWSAQRVMGLLYPPTTGDYRFEITSHTISEFWLSLSQDPTKAVMLARNNKNILYGVNFAKGPSMSKSNSIHLTHGQAVYFEIIHGMNDVGRDEVQVRWMLPGFTSYTGIPKSSLSTIIDIDSSLDAKTRQLVLQSASLNVEETPLKTAKSYKWSNTNFSRSFLDYPSYTKENLHTAKFANRTGIMSVFKVCNYAPSYVIKKKYPRYRGVENTYYSDVFPNDGTWDKIWKDCERAHLCRGNKIVDESVIVDIVNLFMVQVEAKYPGEFKLANVVNVELNADEKLGNRFFLELVLFEVKTKELQRLSEYVYQVKDSKTLCRPKGLVWSPTVKINAIVTAKNQGPWIVQYIQDMARVIHATNDDNVHFVISDYGNNGVDVENEFKRNGLTKYTVVKMNGIFHKTQAIHEAVKSIKDQNSIVFLTDLHLDAPNTLFESVRKHTIQGIIGFTPVVFRLSRCGRQETEQTLTTGFWDGYAFGIISFYKSDWDVFGGVNVAEYKNRWGGEDWEMVDRVLEKGYEVDRLRLPYFYHFNHDKGGMWDKS